MQITEARGVKITKGDDPHRFLLQVITPGMGSSGYYSADVLEAAAESGVFPAGTHLYADHPTKANAGDPRSVRDLAGVTEGAGVWNPATQAIEAPCKVYPHYSWLSEVASDIGMSIRANGEVTQGKIGDQSVPVIESLTECLSVDFVSKAGRGGKIIAAMEAALPDLDHSLWGEGYPASGVSLDANTSVKPAVANSASITTSTQEGEVGAPTMISEADHQAVVTKLAEVESRLAEAQQESATLKAEKRGRELKESAATFVDQVIGTSLDQFPDVFKARVVAESLAEIPTVGDQLDQTAMRTRVEGKIAENKAFVDALGGSRMITGHGSTTAPLAEAAEQRAKSDEAQSAISWSK